MKNKSKTALLSLLLLALSAGALAALAGRERVAAALNPVLVAIAPDTFISWDEEQAVLRCSRAVDGKTSWPETDKYKCRAMHMCAEAGILSAAQTEALRDAAASIPNCSPL